MNTNSFKTAILLGALSGLVIMIGGALGGQTGLVIALGFALVMNLGSYWYSDRIVLSMHRAQPVDESRAPELYRSLALIAERAQIPVPRLYIIPDEAPNAFATGRNPQHGVVAVTEGLLRILTPDEVAGVLAHEIAHIKHRDILIGTIAAILASVISFMANMAQWAAIFGAGRGEDEEGGGLAGTLFLAFLAPIAAGLIQMAISRSREYVADEGGARYSGSPLGLASALRKLETYAQAGRSSASRNTATAHMFIVNPLRSLKLAKLFSTHPDTAERVRRLEAMARKG